MGGLPENLCPVALIAGSRAPDSAKIKQKMLYASSKDALKKELSGVQLEYQATGPDELDIADLIAKADR